MFCARLLPHMPNNEKYNTNKNIANRLRKTNNCIVPKLFMSMETVNL